MVLPIESEQRRTSRATQTVLVAIGAIVLGLWIAAVLAVGWFLLHAWPSIIGISLGLIASVPLLLARPRLPRLPKPSVVIKRSEAPDLFGLIDELSDELGASRLKVLAFDIETNASTTRVGFRRRLAIVVGFPLWEAMTRDERVALLGHEIAHEVNGDLRRSPFVGTSLTVLGDWYVFTYPGPFREASDQGLGEAIAWFLVAIPHLLLGIAVRWQERLVLDNSRRAEFAADLLAADVAGTRACRALFDRLILSNSIDYAVKRAVKVGDHDTWGAIRRRFDELPSHERDTIRQVAMEEELSVDGTHPPTGERLRAIGDAAFQSPKVLLDTSRNSRIDRELDAARAELEPLLRTRAARSDQPY